MTHRHALRQAVRYALVMGAAAATGYSLPALAQEDQGSTSATLEDVVVTGTRIARQDYEAQSPVVTVSSETLKLSGTSQIETVLNTMPQLVPSVSISSNNPSNGGQANINLRGLGVERTLVLLDGSRLTPSNVTGVVDLNTIPTPLIESIEILSGGASSTYGSDAVAGVVNIKLKRNFTGVQFDAGTGWTSENDGKTNIFSVTAGTDIGEGRGNVAVAFGYDERDTVLYSQREFASIQLNQNLAPLGNATIPEGRVDWAIDNLPTQAAWNTVFGKYGVAPGTIVAASNPAIGFNQDRTTFTIAPVRNFRGDTTVPGYNPASYGYNAFLPNNLVLPLTRRQASLFGHYEIVPDKVELYGRAMWTKYHADQALAPTPVTGPTVANATFDIPYCITGTAAANCFVGSSATNPILLNSPDLLALANSRTNPTAKVPFVRRVIEAGNRIAVNDYEVKQGLLGFRGKFGNGWKWDIFGSYGENDYVYDQYGNLSRSKIVAAVGNPSGGLAGCTNFNPLGLNSINAGCTAAISVVANNFLYLKQTNAVGSLSGDLFDLPAGAVLFAAGVEYRKNEADFQPDQVLATGDVVGFNAQKPIQGKIEVTEPFVELSIPLLSEMTAVKYLGLDLGYRYSDYNLSGSVDTYKAALQWNPVESLKVRGSYNRSIRAPNISELFLPVQESFPAYADPCRVGSPERSGAAKAQVEALCIAQGIPAAVLANFTQRNTQARTFIGGNTALEPEVADTYSFGVTWQSASESEWASQLSASVDYFDFTIEKKIGALTASSVVGGCFNQLNRNPSYSNSNPFCQLFTRDQSGAVTGIVATNLNLGGNRGQGIDLQVDYGLPLTAFGASEDAGSLTINLVATHILKQENQDTIVDPFVRADGTITSSTASALPKWKGTLATTWKVGDLSLRWSLRYIDGMDVKNPDAALTRSTGIRPYTASFVYHDASVRWRATDAFDVALTVNNVSNKPPALYTTSTQAGIQANTDPSTYDILGRRYFLNFGYKF